MSGLSINLIVNVIVLIGLIVMRIIREDIDYGLKKTIYGLLIIISVINMFVLIYRL